MTTVANLHQAAIARASPMSGPASGRSKVFGTLTIDSPHSMRSQKSNDHASPQSQLSVQSRVSFSTVSPNVHAFCPKSPFDTLKTKAIGQELEYRLDFEHPERASVSPWHDLPHQVTANTYTMVVEIPRGERAKLEVQPKVQGNPIKQDVKNGKPRYFQLGDLPFNYGMIPQTWEDPRVLDKETGLGGDGDPLDVVEISGKSFAVGGTHEVKVLGALGLIDEGEMDWKLVVVDVHNPFAAQLNDIQDVENLFPGKLKKILHWYRFYKVPEGKGENQFAYNGDFKDAAFAVALIDKHHKQYMDLIAEGPQDTHVWTPPGPLNALKPTKIF